MMNNVVHRIGVDEFANVYSVTLDRANDSVIRVKRVASFNTTHEARMVAALMDDAEKAVEPE